MFSMTIHRMNDRYLHRYLHITWSGIEIVSSLYSARITYGTAYGNIHLLSNKIYKNTAQLVAIHSFFFFSLLSILLFC